MLFTPEILDRVNQEVVRAGQQALKKSPEEGLNARADSFVVETNAEYPTDTGLLYDAVRAVRKALGLCAELSEAHGLSGWRQDAHHRRKFKQARRRIQKLRHSTAQDEGKRQARLGEIQQAHRDYLGQAETLIARMRGTRDQLAALPATPLRLAALDGYLKHAERQADQIRRRVLAGEAIPHAEKVFSIFQPHTEWVAKGKAGVLVELGLKVCVVEDQHRFILHHQVMEKATDDQVAVPVTEQAKQRFPELDAISFDKGFHRPANQSALKEIVGLAVLPRKGKLAEAAKAAESEPAFARLRRRHSVVESAINALGHHGLAQGAVFAGRPVRANSAGCQGQWLDRQRRLRSHTRGEANTESCFHPVQRVKANAATDMQKVIQGNLVWRSLNQNNVFCFELPKSV